MCGGGEADEKNGGFGRKNGKRRRTECSEFFLSIITVLKIDSGEGNCGRIYG